MTTLYREKVRCRNCGETSEHTVIGSTNAFGSPDLDLRPPEMQRSTMHAWLQLCPHCGFSAPDLAKSECDRSIIESPQYRATLANEEFPELSRRFLVRALLLQDSAPAEAARARLWAAWSCDDVRLDHLAVECRLGAASLLEQLERSEDNEADLTRGAILVDLLRRAGQFGRATMVCEALLRNRSATGVLKQVLEFQQRLILKGDRTAHSVAEVMRGE